ncbi:MAG: YihY/virulence factor BrkB family protein [Bacteroidales bacterium]|jgi:membrane protein|nr:YihY/virulence factor BrkB family protein [Bacteroidales bacterium]
MNSISKIKNIILRAIRFIKNDVWSVRMDDYSSHIAFFLKLLRIILVALRRFFEDKVQLRASGLTFYSLLALVPILAMGFGISKGFGLDKELERYLMDNFKGQQEVLNWLLSFVSSTLENAKGGIIAGVGFAILFWSVMRMLGNIENSFNDIWQVKKNRSYVRKFTDYLSLMLVAPILIIAASSGTIFVATQLSNISNYIGIVNLNPFIIFLVKLFPYAMIWLLFTLLYMIMPNTRVSFKSALIAGIIAGTAFQIVQWVYIDLQVGMSRYNAIYGSFAAIPLLLVWMQMSWLIVLLGAEISYASQNIDLYEWENEALQISAYAHRAYCILLLQHIVVRFATGKPPMSARKIANRLKLPIRLVRTILTDMLAAGLVAESHGEKEQSRAYMPAADIKRYTIQYVADALDKSGNNGTLQKPSDEMKKILYIQQQLLQHLTNVPENIPIQDLPDFNPIIN